MIRSMPFVAGRVATLLAGGAFVLSPVPAMAAGKSLPDRFAVGADVNRDPCTATRAWAQGSAIRNEADQPFVVTCRGSTEQRALVDVAADRLVIAPDLCGAVSAMSLEGLGPVTLRRCYDPRFGGEAVVIETPTARGSALPSTLGPVVAALRSLRAHRVIEGAVALDPKLVLTLAAPPVGAGQHGEVVAASGIDASSAIKQGMQSIYAGRNVEASRLLNDAVAQFATVSPLQRAELRLDAGLADSNIGEFGAASTHFAEANTLLAAQEPSSARARLMTQATAYEALNLANQGRWQAVLDRLNTTASGGFPLVDPVTLARLNQRRGSDLQVGLDTDQVNELIIVAQQNVARSTAYLRLGNIAQAQAALHQAKVNGVDSAQALLASGSANSAGSLNWLRARLERQEGRILQASGDIDGALASFDCALAVMHAVAPKAGAACLFTDTAAARGTALSGPSIAEAELERTAILSLRPGIDRASVVAQYEQAVTTLAEASDGASTPSPLLARYLAMLVEDAAGGDSSAAPRYFAALQTVREPGIAREYAALQSVVSHGAAGGLIRDRQDLERRQAQLRYEIASLPADAPGLEEARRQRDAVAVKLEQVKLELAQSGVAAAVDDAPVTIDAVQASLRPGEDYLKLSDVGGRLFGVVLTREERFIYTVDTPAEAVQVLAAKVLASAQSHRGADGQLRILPFASDTSYELFRHIAGPATATLTRASAVVVDTGSALGGLPAAVLVTAPVKAATTASADYGSVPFLVRKAELASALSPRAFIRVRTTLAPSAAKQLLIGFGQNAPAAEPATPAIARMPIAVAATCSVAYGRWATIMRGNPPIPADEIRVAAAELGDADAPVVTGDAFTNAAIMADSRDGKLSGYQVLHFATHGIPATTVPGMCETPLPPSLITSLQAPTPEAPSPSNGLLSYIDVARLNLDANLVVLSACETASSVSTEAGRLAGQEDSAPTLDGLVRAFIVAQARAVMATYWRVPAAQGTSALIARFYKAGHSEGMGQALREAQMAVMAQAGTSHPYYWGAFFLVGDGARTMVNRQALAAR